MKLQSVVAVVRALNEAGVRYLVAGGLAVNAHGYLRYTKDADLILDLDPTNVRAAFAALAVLGYGPTVAVTAESFADRQQREAWIRDKNMRVLSFWSDPHRETPVDVFVEEPVDFEAEWRRALIKDLPEAGPVRFVSLATLMEMKRAAGRVQDLADLDNLRLRLDSRDEREG